MKYVGLKNRAIGKAIYYMLTETFCFIMHENPVFLKPVDVQLIKSITSVAPGVNILTEPGNIQSSRCESACLQCNNSKEEKPFSAVNVSGVYLCKPQSSNDIVIWVVSGVLHWLLIGSSQTSPTQSHWYSSLEICLRSLL